MRGILKSRIIMVLLAALIFTNCFGKDESKAANKKSEESIGFLSNIRQLKELSDIMDVINQNYVGDKEIDKKSLM